MVQEGPGTGREPPAGIGRGGVAWQRITVDTHVTRGPIVLFGVWLTSDAVGNADATLYEGANTGGRRMFTIRATQYRTAPMSFSKGIFLEDGLYVDVGTNVLEVFLVYEQVRE